MKYLAILTVGVCLLISTAMAAQETPKPGSEHKKMDFYEGNWTCEAESSAGKSGGNMKCEWVAGGFFMKCSMPWKQPTGATVETFSIMGYDRHSKSYTWYRYWGNGWSDFARIWINDQTWNYVYEGELINGKLQRRQVTVTPSSSDSWTFKWERSVEGGPWQVTQEGKCTKVKETNN